MCKHHTYASLHSTVYTPFKKENGKYVYDEQKQYVLYSEGRKNGTTANMHTNVHRATNPNACNKASL